MDLSFSDISQWLPVRLTKLLMAYVSLPEEVLKKWFSELNGKLSNLIIVGIHQTDAVLELKSIESLERNIKDLQLAAKMIEINANHLEGLKLYQEMLKGESVWTEVVKVQTTRTESVG